MRGLVSGRCLVVRIAITGATGNVGTALLRRLAREEDIDVIGLARRIPRPDAGPPYGSVEWHAIDLGDKAAPDRLADVLLGVDAVVHLAWQLQPSHRRGRLYRTNVTGTRNLIEAMRRTQVRKLVYASSVGAYAPAPKDRYVDENWPATGVRRSSYSVHKAAVEALLDDAERNDPQLRVVRMRQALVFQRDAGSEIARYFLGPFVPRRLLRRGRIPVIPRNKRLRAQAVHADDLAEAYLQALRRDVTGAFNTAAEPVLDGPLLAAELGARAVPVPIPVMRLLASLSWHARLQPTEPGWIDLAAAAPIMDSSRAEDALNWHPQRDARQAVSNLLGGMRTGTGTPAPPMRPASPPARRLLDGVPGHANPA
jgi:UDP-glucose 4-epimerase